MATDTTSGRQIERAAVLRSLLADRLASDFAAFVKKAWPIIHPTRLRRDAGQCGCGNVGRSRIASGGGSTIGKILAAAGQARGHASSCRNLRTTEMANR